MTGAYQELLDTDGETPLSIAEEKEHAEIVAILKGSSPCIPSHHYHAVCHYC